MSNDVRAFQPGPTVTQNLAVTAGAASITLNNTAGTRQPSTQRLLRHKV
jgi:hypothetical protein